MCSIFSKTSCTTLPKSMGALAYEPSFRSTASTYFAHARHRTGRKLVDERQRLVLRHGGGCGILNRYEAEGEKNNIGRSKPSNSRFQERASLGRTSFGDMEIPIRSRASASLNQPKVCVHAYKCTRVGKKSRRTPKHEIRRSPPNTTKFVSNF